MKRKSCLLLVLILALSNLISAQNIRMPRDPDKLIDRVQKFWAAMTASQRSKAVDFVLPAKRDIFLSGTPTPITKAQVVGLDFTKNAEEAAVRVAIQVLSAENTSGFLSWTLTDPWIWKGDNWFLDIPDNPGIFRGGPEQAAAGKKDLQKDIEKNFEILRKEIDLGTLIQGQYPPPLEIPIKYTGDRILSLELGLTNPIVSLGDTGHITSSTNNFVLLVSAENWEGPFTLPLPLKIRSGDAVVERTLLVKGSVFVPLVFRQSPADGPVPNRDFSIFIQNNTDELAQIHSVVVDGKMDLQKQPEAVLPHQEVELVFKPHPDEVPDRLYLQLDSPIQGRSSYTYPIRAGRR